MFAARRSLVGLTRRGLASTARSLAKGRKVTETVLGKDGKPLPARRKPVAHGPPPKRPGAAQAEARAAEEEALNMPLRERLKGQTWPFLIYSFFAASYGVYMTTRDDTSYLVTHLDQLMGFSLTEDDLVSLARTTNINETLQHMLIESPQYVGQLVALVHNTDLESVFRAQAAKVLENAARSSHTLSVEERVALALSVVDLVSDRRAPLLVRKNIANMLCNLVHGEGTLLSLPDMRDIPAEFVRPEIFDALTAVINNIYIHRNAFEQARRRLAWRALDAGTTQGAFDDDSWALVQSLAAEEEATQASWLHRTHAQAVDSGLLLYLHTAIGGAAWGLTRSLMNGDTLRPLLRNVIRTSLVTSLVPIYVVGGVVTAYNHYRKKIDDSTKMMLFHTGTAMLLFPFVPLMPVLDAWAPLWIGGHVVGFMSFFGWLYWTDADLLKADGEIMMREAMLEAAASPKAE